MNEFESFEDSRASSEARVHGGRRPDRRSSSIWTALSKYLWAEERHTIDQRHTDPHPATGAPEDTGEDTAKDTG